jgi:hypothetical protein
MRWRTLGNVSTIMHFCCYNTAKAKGTLKRPRFTQPLKGLCSIFHG